MHGGDERTHLPGQEIKNFPHTAKVKKKLYEVLLRGRITNVPQNQFQALKEANAGDESRLQLFMTNCVETFDFHDILGSF